MTYEIPIWTQFFLLTYVSSWAIELLLILTIYISHMDCFTSYHPNCIKSLSFPLDEILGLQKPASSLALGTCELECSDNAVPRHFWKKTKTNKQTKNYFCILRVFFFKLKKNSNNQLFFHYKGNNDGNRPETGSWRFKISFNATIYAF